MAISIFIEMIARDELLSTVMRIRHIVPYMKKSKKKRALNNKTAIFDDFHVPLHSLLIWTIAFVLMSQIIYFESWTLFVFSWHTIRNKSLQVNIDTINTNMHRDILLHWWRKAIMFIIFFRSIKQFENKITLFFLLYFKSNWQDYRSLQNPKQWLLTVTSFLFYESWIYSKK